MPLQSIALEECLQNDVLCFEWVVKHYLLFLSQILIQSLLFMMKVLQFNIDSWCLLLQYLDCVTLSEDKYFCFQYIFRRAFYCDFILMLSLHIHVPIEVQNFQVLY